jgi:tRNA 5-methylaminomethyl-2-thiouridine biosynthesis bifunctional protein
MQFSNIKWINNMPYSIDFNDIYFSTEDGLDETEYVFIQQNQLEQRFKSLQQDHFTITETGFGTGLNFLVTCQHWLRLAPANAQLHFISIEKFPLTLADLTHAHALWPQFAAISSELLQQYNLLKSGTNVFSMAGDRIKLALQVDDILHALPQITQKADAWFLDGFAPAKNAEMWSANVFVHLARLSQANTTFATFTSAGTVRRSLQAAGFNVEKHAGFGKKREMLSGIFLSSAL